MPKVLKGLHNFSLSNMHRLKRGHTLEKCYAANNPNAPTITNKRPNRISATAEAAQTHFDPTETAEETLEQTQAASEESSAPIETYFNEENEEVQINAASEATDNFLETMRASNSLE